MKFVKQHVNIDVRNLDFINLNECKRRHSSLLPNNIRCLIVGPSGAGKTNIILSLIDYFKNLYIKLNIII